ncbi:hypothetical protein [Parasediminibacterium sp. JCM 36343]|uniref:hypothetical protein n=1 Tax=Parasediminibacterium sp. JCM 36343 TaxID=3374279 RepID=UPI00397B54A8
MLTTSISSNQISEGNNSCKFFYNHGGSGFPIKMLEILTDDPVVFLDEGGNETQKISWKTDKFIQNLFQKDIVIKAGGGLNDGDVFKINVTVTDSLGIEEYDSILIHFTI